MKCWFDGLSVRVVVILALLLVLLNCVDGFFTVYQLQHGKEEANPIPRFFMETFGIGTGMFLAKLIILPAAALLLYLGVKGKNLYLARLGLVSGCVIYGVLVGYHVYLLNLGVT